MTRRSLSWYASHPRAFDEAVGDWNDRELARYEAMAWLTSIEPGEGF